MKQEDKIKLINEVVRSFFQGNKDINKIAAKELMLDFKKANIFGGQDETGKQLRELFRDLKKEKQLKQIPALLGEPKGKNTFWYFIRINGVV
jgi:phage anti-repressor protein